MARGTYLLPFDEEEKRAEDRGKERGNGWKGGVRYRQSQCAFKNICSEPWKEVDCQ